MTAAPEAGKRAAPPDWRHAARLLARGDTLNAVVRQVGCSRSQLSRKRNHDAKFRTWIEQFRKIDEDPEERLVRLRCSAQEVIDEEVGKGNVRVALWLADRLKLVTPSDERTNGDALQELLNGLTPEERRELEMLREPESAQD